MSTSRYPQGHGAVTPEWNSPLDFSYGDLVGSGTEGGDHSGLTVGGHDLRCVVGRPDRVHGVDKIVCDVDTGWKFDRGVGADFPEPDDGEVRRPGVVAGAHNVEPDVVVGDDVG